MSATHDAENGATFMKHKLPTVEILPVEPGDRLVLHSDVAMTHDAIVRIRERFREEYPNNSLMILDKGMKLSVYRPEDG